MPSPGRDLSLLARFVADSSVQTMPAEIARVAKACLLYGLAVGIASSAADLPSRLLKLAALQAGSPGEGARRILDGSWTTVEAAAFANAVLLHVRIQEDAHPAGHVGVVVLPAALASAEARGATGRDLLAAIVAGYEVALRLGRDHAADLSNRGLRTTSVYGVIGAAAAAARLAGLDAERARNALALAANMAGGLREFIEGGTPEYAIHAAIAARNGLTAAALAEAGVPAAATTLDGAAGFFRAFGEAGVDYTRRLTDKLGETFELSAVAYKPYPTCQFHGPALRALVRLRAEAGDRAIQAMRLRLNPFEAEFFGVRFAGPFHGFPQTFMSLPFCAAVAWLDGGVSFARMHDFADARLLELVPKVEVVADDDMPRYLPHASVVLEDGDLLTADAREGQEAFAMTWRAALDMAFELADEAGIPESAVRDLIAAVDELDGGGTPAAVADAACRAVAAGRA